MDEWQEDIAAATAAAEQTQAREEEAEARFDAVWARAEAEGRQEEAPQSAEFRQWMEARHATDTAWGRWAQVMDSKPSA